MDYVTEVDSIQQWERQKYLKLTLFAVFCTISASNIFNISESFSVSRITVNRQSEKSVSVFNWLMVSTVHLCLSI